MAGPVGRDVTRPGGGDDTPAMPAFGAAGERALISTGPVPVLERPEEEAPLVTELILGERLVVLEERGGWLRVLVPGHATALDPRGYPGWTRPDGLVEAPGWDPRLAVVAPNDAGLPLGALLGEAGGEPRLPGGGPAALEAGAARPLGEAPAGASPVEISRGLLGLPYRWGGALAVLLEGEVGGRRVVRVGGVAGPLRVLRRRGEHGGVRILHRPDV